MKKLEAGVLADVSSASPFAGFAGSLICRRICVAIFVSHSVCPTLFGVVLA